MAILSAAAGFRWHAKYWLLWQHPSWDLNITSPWRKHQLMQSVKKPAKIQILQFHPRSAFPLLCWLKSVFWDLCSHCLPIYNHPLFYHNITLTTSIIKHYITLTTSIIKDHTECQAIPTSWSPMSAVTAWLITDMQSLPNYYYGYSLGRLSLSTMRNCIYTLCSELWNQKPIVQAHTAYFIKPASMAQLTPGTHSMDSSSINSIA